MFLFAPLAKKFAPPPDPSPQRKQMRGEISQILAQLRILKGGDVSEEFAARLDAFARNSDRLEAGIVAWMNLLEQLVQGAEQRYPDGRGSRKKAQVTAAMHQLITTDDFQIPAVPDYLQPVVLDLAVDWSVDILVSDINQFNLWDDSEPMPITLGNLFWGGLARAIKLFEPVARVLGWLYVKLRYSEPLTPEVQAAVDRARVTNLIRTKRDIFGSPADLLVFVAQHRDQVVAGCRLFFEVVQEAQRFETKSGPGKKAYARDLVIAVLEELGFPVGGGLFGGIVTGFIDAAIESAFSVLSRRAPELFNNRGTSSAKT